MKTTQKRLLVVGSVLLLVLAFVIAVLFLSDFLRVVALSLPEDEITRITVADGLSTGELTELTDGAQVRDIVAAANRMGTRVGTYSGANGYLCTLTFYDGAGEQVGSCTVVEEGTLSIESYHISWDTGALLEEVNGALQAAGADSPLYGQTQ